MNHAHRGEAVRGADVDNDNDGSRDDDNVSDDEDDGSGDDDETDADGHDNGEDCDDEDVEHRMLQQQACFVAHDAAVEAAAVAAAQNGQPPPKFLCSVLKAFARRNGVPYEVQSDILRRHTLTMAEIMNPSVPFPIPFTLALIDFMKDEIRDQRIALPLRGTCGCHACQLRTPIFCAFSNVVSDFQ
jgi:hypothetical protein